MNAVTTTQNMPPMERFKQEITLREEMISAILPSTVTFDAFKAKVVAAVGANPKLLEADRGSLIKACIQAAELGLSLNPTLGECDILPVYPNQAQLRPRYMGLMKLARQSGEVLKIESRIVYARDEFEVIEGTDPQIIHKRKLGERGEPVGAYCVWTLKNGEKQFEVMGGDQINEIRDRSEGWKAFSAGKIKSTPWSTDPEEMWRKTVVRRASKYMPRSCENFLKAVAVDNLREVGHEVDFQGGEVIDVTATEPPPKTDPKRTPQVDRLAEKVARKARPEPEPEASVDAEIEPEPDVVSLESMEAWAGDDGKTDWYGWCVDATERLKVMPLAARKTWREMHADLIDEAELIEPGECRKLKLALAAK